MKIIFVYGLPGVGKLTVAKELVKQTKLKLFHNHMVLDLIIDVFGREVRPIVQLREEIWIKFFKQAVVENSEGLIFTFCFDKYLSKTFLKDIENAIKPHGSIFFVELTCSDEALKKRLQSFSRTGQNKMRDFDDLKRQMKDKSLYIPVLKRNVLKIDNTNVAI